MDALLGAAGLGDLGTRFPSDDAAYEGADSLELLRRVGGLVRGGGGEVVSVDATVVAESPRLGPHVEAMRERIAGALGVDVACVSVKAKTNEGLGPIGASEAIAAMSVALISR
jgi:2-C-methyl-D-erythritol 2,4-cyclodiphosphate synthase